MARNPEDYGIGDLSDPVLRVLAGDVRRYGEKGKFAQRELASRQGALNEADMYRSALERAAYGDAGRQYGQGLGQISSYLAGAGPLADSGAATALRARLASGIYGQAAGRIGQGYASYLGNLMNQRRNFRYQQALLRLQQKLQPHTGIGGVLGGLAGTALGSLAGGYGAALGGRLGAGIGGGGY